MAVNVKLLFKTSEANISPAVEHNAIIAFGNFFLSPSKVGFSIKYFFSPKPINN